MQQATRKSTRKRKEVAYQKEPSVCGKKNAGGQTKITLLKDDIKSGEVDATDSPEHLGSETAPPGPIVGIILKCFACDKYFSNKRELKHHVVKNHKQNMCPFCEKVLVFDLDLSSHFLDAHN